MENEVKKQTTALLARSEAFTGSMPDLSKAKADPLPINGEYWTPSQVGEKRRMFFMDLCVEQTIDQTSGEDIDLMVAYFVWPHDGRQEVVRQAGRRLTAVFENFVKAGSILPGMAFEITYLGKQKNKNNAFSSDTWSIVTLATE